MRFQSASNARQGGAARRISNTRRQTLERLSLRGHATEERVAQAQQLARAPSRAESVARQESEPEMRVAKGARDLFVKGQCERVKRIVRGDAARRAPGLCEPRAKGVLFCFRD